MHVHANRSVDGYLVAGLGYEINTLGLAGGLGHSIMQGGLGDSSGGIRPDGLQRGTQDIPTGVTDKRRSWRF
jgi:hypothetical protein